MNDIEDGLSDIEVQDRWYLSNRLCWMTDDQWKCMQLLGDLFLGFHHMNTKKVKPCGNGISYYVDHWTPSTFDNSELTRLVKLSHDMCIRSSIKASRSGTIKLMLFKRAREGRMHERHPRWEDIV